MSSALPIAAIVWYPPWFPLLIALRVSLIAMYIHCHDLAMNLAGTSFNQVQDKGVLAAWCTSLIHPIFKAGTLDDSSYRGITVVAILANQ